MDAKWTPKRGDGWFGLQTDSRISFYGPRPTPTRTRDCYRLQEAAGGGENDVACLRSSALLTQAVGVARSGVPRSPQEYLSTAGVIRSMRVWPGCRDACLDGLIGKSREEVCVSVRSVVRLKDGPGGAYGSVVPVDPIPITGVGTDDAGVRFNSTVRRMDSN